MPADPHNGALSLTPPQQRMLRRMLDAREGHTEPVRPWRSEWRTADVLIKRGLAVLDVQPDGNTQTRYHLMLTEAGEQWATTLRHLGKPAGYRGRV